MHLQVFEPNRTNEIEHTGMEKGVSLEYMQSQ